MPVFRARAWLKGTTKSPQRTSSSSGEIASYATRDSSTNPFESTQFLGSDRNGIVSNREFSVRWDSQLPKVVWKIPIGAGWSSFAVSSGLAITLEQIDEQESITALELTTGNVLWRQQSPGRHTQAFGGVGPRSTPTIYRGKVFAQTAMGIVSCVELQTGNLIWQQDLLKLAGIDKETSEKAISWGRSGSPLVVDDQIVVPFGGRSGDSALRSLIAFELETGKERWRSGQNQITYSSPVLMTLCGVRQIVNVNEGVAVGCNPANGKVIWTTEWPSNSNGDACSSQAVQLDERRLLLGKGYSLGSKAIELTYSGTTPENESDPAFWKVEPVWSNTKILKTKFTSSILFDGSLFGLSDGVLECVDPKDGTRIWRGKKYGQGQLIVVNQNLLVTTEDGRIVLIPATREGLGKAIAELPVLEGITWNVPAVAGPYLLVRNAEFAACLISSAEAGHDAKSAIE
jgi:outer membrane protein assembly factor BamB